MRKFIYGVYDKTLECGQYYGFFENIDDAKEELKNQMLRLESEHGTKGLILKDDRVVIEDEDDIIFILHSYVLR